MDKTTEHPSFDIMEDSVVRPDSLNVRRVFVRGFPSEINGMDCDKFKIRTRSLFAEGAVNTIQKDSVADHCYAFEFSKPKEIECMTGISGSPIFAIDARGRTQLLGVVYQGGTGDKLGFIGVEVLWSMLKRM